MLRMHPVFPFTVPCGRDFAMNPSVLPLPQQAVLPDYGEGGLYGLARGMRAWLQDRDAGWPLAGVAPGEQALVVLIVIDGLGDDFLRRHGRGSALLAQRAGRLSSVFPSTTASAVTTLMTGIAPAEHGLTGWFIHDRRFGGVIAPLPLLQRGNGPLEAFALGSRLFPYPSAFQGAQRPAVVVSPGEIAGSRYSLRHARGARVTPYASLEGMEEAVVAEVGALRQGGGLIHAYYPSFDALSHHYGSHSDQVLSCFHRIDAVFARLMERLAGGSVRLLLTADHGFIDSPPERALQLEDWPDIPAMLAAPLFGERRVSFCALRPGAEREFTAWAETALAGRAVLASGEALRASGLLGPGRPHRRLAERVGTHALLMEPGWTIADRVEGEKPYVLRGVHGGLSADEMWVPLIRFSAGLRPAAPAAP
jgi:hypothetical protein